MSIKTDPSFLAFIGVLVGTVLGTASSILTTYATAKNSLKIQSNSEKHRRENDFNIFQREQLLKLQKLFAKATRLHARAHLQDINQYKRTDQLSTEFDEDILNSNLELSLLVERVHDDNLRKSMREFRAQMTTLHMTAPNTSKSQHEDLTGLLDLAQAFEKLMEEIGKVLRDTHSIS